ncbi:MAG TPA: hypothetical protein VJQ55_15335, partial [Candidatus Binatia bacterium]|nr:hypothetical protein [Candidatus Binatia bacterium]
ERLGKDAEELLRVASVIGREFPLSLIKELMGYEDDRLIENLDRCEGAALISSQQAGGEEIYSFRHDMMQEALYESIGPARRRRHHLRVGIAIEKFYGSRLEDWYEALGKHFFEGNDLAKAVDYSLKAGDRASAVSSWGRASDHYQTAFEILEEFKSHPREQAEVLEQLALATMWFGRGGDSLGQWKKALSIYETLGDKKKAGAVHLRLYQQYYSAIGPRDREKGYRHCVEALSLLESEGDSVELAQAYTRLGLISAHRQNVPLSTGIDPLEKGLALARRLGNPAAIAEADMSLGHVLVYHAGEIKRGLEFADEAYEAAQKSGDTVLLADTAIRAAEDYLILLDTDAIWGWAKKAMAVSNDSGILRHQIQSTLLHVWVYILWGETQQALLTLETAQRMAKTAGVEFSQMPRPPARLAAIIVPFFAGDWDKCEAELLTWQDWPSDVVLVLIAWVSGWLSLEKGDLAEAKARLREAVNRCEIRGEKTLAVAPLALLSQVASKAGELDESAAYLRRAQEITSPSQDWRGLFGDVFLAEAMLAASEKRWEKANKGFQEAVEIYQRYKTPYYQARALFEWAKMYGLRNRRADRKRAGELVDRALHLFEKIQAKKMLQKVQAEKRSLVR